MGCFVLVIFDACRPPGPSAAEDAPNTSPRIPVGLRQAHGDCMFPMDSNDAFTVHSKYAVIRAVDPSRFQNFFLFA